MEKEEKISGSINVIPEGIPGKCREILVVFIGNRDNFEKRIFQAIEHCTALCRGITKYVIFFTMKWDSVIWIRHRRSFTRDDITVVKKALEECPVRLC